MRTVYTYPGNSTSSNEIGWDEAWSKYSVTRTLAWNEHSETINILEKYLPKNGKIIDASCGLGRIVIHFRNKGYDIIGIDWSKKTIEAVKEYDPGMPVKCADARHLDFPDAPFSAYISGGVVEHSQKGPLGILKEAHRVLADKDGLLFISIPIYNICMKLTLPIKELNTIRRLFSRKLLEKNNRGFDYYLYTLKEFKCFLEKAGFEIIEMRPILQAAGLYRCFPFFRNRKIAKEFDIQGHTAKCLNIFGRLFLNIFKRITPWAFSTCVFCIAKKIK